MEISQVSPLKITGMDLVELLLTNGSHSIKTYVNLIPYVTAEGEVKTRRLCGVRIDNRPFQLNLQHLHPAFVWAFREARILGSAENIVADEKYLRLTNPMTRSGTFAHLASTPKEAFIVITENAGHNGNRRARLYSGKSIRIAIRRFMAEKPNLDSIFNKEPALAVLLKQP